MLSRVKKTSNALVILVETKEDCLKKRRISELDRQFQTTGPAIENARRSYRFESTARYDELVSVCRTQTKPRNDVRGCDEMVMYIAC